MTEGKYGTITSSAKQFHLGEPIFILRAIDPLAPEAINHYAGICERDGCSEEHVRAAVVWANRIREWQRGNPELVKERPD